MEKTSINIPSPGAIAATAGLQGEQARDLHGQRLQRRVARGGREKGAAQSEHHAQGHCDLELGEEQDAWTDWIDHTFIRFSYVCHFYESHLYMCVRVMFGAFEMAVGCCLGGFLSGF